MAVHFYALTLKSNLGNELPAPACLSPILSETKPSPSCKYK